MTDLAAPAAPPATAPAAPPATAPDAPPLPKETNRMLRRVLDDSLVIVAAHVHDDLLASRALRERIVRYLYNVKHGRAKATVFTQTFKNHVWSEVKDLDADSRECDVLFPATNRFAKHCAETGADTIVFVIDFMHTAAPLATVRYTGMWTLLRDAPARDFGKSAGRAAERVEQQVANSRLVEHHATWDGIGTLRTATDGQRSIIKPILNELIQERNSIAAEFYETLYMATIREACIVHNIHADFLAADAATPLGPPTCFMIIRSGAQTLKVETLKESDLVARVAPAPDTEPHPLTTVYNEALQLMRKPREPGVAVLIVVYAHDGPTATMSSAVSSLADMRQLSAGVDEERAARQAHVEKMRAQLAAALK